MPKFARTIEDFICGQCGQAIKGNGYTNHCPKCLWSRHVDVNPGDRAAACGGLMEPLAIEGSVKQYYVVQRCQRCGHERRNKLTPQDDFFQAIELSKHQKF